MEPLLHRAHTTRLLDCAPHHHPTSHSLPPKASSNHPETVMQLFASLSLSFYHQITFGTASSRFNSLCFFLLAFSNCVT